jgi:pyridoxamine 5'-phosphate oxidase
MIDIKATPNNQPYKLFCQYYDLALKNNQQLIEAIAISSFDAETNSVDSRYVNLKYIISEDWIFFSNYKSKKAKHFKDHKQISALIHWSSINLQIRMSAEIKKTSSTFSDSHFEKRSKSKNALAISSMQSQEISCHDDVKANHLGALKKMDTKTKRPDYWGGYTFIPCYFEFWNGHESRLNKRDVYEKYNNEWKHKTLQP